MSKFLNEVMTRNPVSVSPTESCAAAARSMASSGIGDVLVRDVDGRLAGIVTDRDIVVRAVAMGRDPATTPVGDICTRNVVSLTPFDDVEHAVRLMRDKAIRRLPIVDGGRAVGVVTIGDLAQERDPNSVLGRMSVLPPNG